MGGTTTASSPAASPSGCFPIRIRSAAACFSPRTRTITRSIGVLEYRTPTAAIGGSLDAQDFNTDIYIPISTMRQRIGDFVYTRRGSSPHGRNRRS